MSDIDLLPPNVKMDSDLNLKIRVRMLAQVILDLVEECGATDCKDSIKKGIIDRAIINGLTLSYIDSKKIIRAEITFQIDWDKLELKAKANDKITIIDGLDINKFLAQQLDPRLCAELSRFVARLNEKYDIIHFIRREMLDFTAFPVFFVSNLLLVQRKKYYFNRATVSRNCSIVL
jgi:hypothetical protein